MIYTGYLGSVEQIDSVIDFAKEFRTEKSLLFVDPAMGDHGRLYTGFDKDFPSHMARLCSVADIIVPNITEASFMLGIEYKSEYDEDYIRDILKRLCKMGPKRAILTGVSYEKNTQGAALYNSETDELYYYFEENVPMSFHGTGDTFASVFAGGLCRGLSDKDALRLAVEFTVECIKATVPHAKEHSYGTMFESCIPSLISKLK